MTSRPSGRTMAGDRGVSWRTSETDARGSHPHQQQHLHPSRYHQQQQQHHYQHGQQANYSHSPQHHQQQMQMHSHHHHQQPLYSRHTQLSPRHLPPPPPRDGRGPGGINSLIPSFQKVVKFNLNPTYGKGPGGRAGGTLPHANRTSDSSGILHPGIHAISSKVTPKAPQLRGRSSLMRARSMEDIASQETGVELDPDILSRNKRNLPCVPSFKHPTSPTMPMAKMKHLKDMISNSDLNFKRKIQVSPIPRYSREHEMKFGSTSKTATLDRSSRPYWSYFTNSPSSSIGTQFQYVHPSVMHPGARMVDSFHPSHTTIVSQLTPVCCPGSSLNSTYPMQRSLPGSPVRAFSRNSFNFPSSHHHQHLHELHSLNQCNPSCPYQHLNQNPFHSSQRDSVLHHHHHPVSPRPLTLSNPDLRTPYRYSHQPAVHPLSASSAHQHHHHHLQSSPLCSSPTHMCCKNASCSYLGQATTTTSGGVRAPGTTTNPHDTSSLFPSLSEVTKPPFLEPTFNCVDKYDYNYDNYFRAKRDKLQPFFRSAPSSRSGTPIDGYLNTTTMTVNNNPFVPSPPPPPLNYKSMAGKEAVKDSNPSAMSTDTKQLFKNQLKYFIEERKNELGLGASYQPQKGSESDIDALLTFYSYPPDPVKAKFPPPGKSTYQSVPQAYFDPSVVSFTPMLGRRHSLGGERELSSCFRASPSPYPSFYASYAPPTASSLLHPVSASFSNIYSASSFQHHPYHHQHLLQATPAGATSSLHTARPSSPYPRTMLYGDDALDQALGHHHHHPPFRHHVGGYNTTSSLLPPSHQSSTTSEMLLSGPYTSRFYYK